MTNDQFEPGVNIENFGGMCPVQVEGTIDGLPFYFRGRHSTIYLTIAKEPNGDALDDDAWCYEEQYGDGDFAAGCIPHNEVVDFINKAIKIYREKA